MIGRGFLVVAIGLLSSPALAGAVDKFDKKPPEYEGYSARSIHDVERCLINMERVTVPYVYRQPDRPDDTMLLWTGASVNVAARIDLKRQGEGTFVRMWMGSKEAHQCAPVTASP